MLVKSQLWPLVSRQLISFLFSHLKICSTHFVNALINSAWENPGRPQTDLIVSVHAPSRRADTYSTRVALETGQEAQKINIPSTGCQNCSSQSRGEMLRDVTAFFATQEHFHLLPKTRNTVNTQYLANRKNTNWTFFTVKYCAVKLYVLVWVWWRPLPPLESKLFCHAL